MVKYTLYFMKQSTGTMVYYVQFGCWLSLLHREHNDIVILMHGIITRYYYLEYKKAGKIPLFFDSTLKCWAIENPYNEEYYKTIDTDRSKKFVTWLYKTDLKEVFSSEG